MVDNCLQETFANILAGECLLPGQLGTSITKDTCGYLFPYRSVQWKPGIWNSPIHRFMKEDHHADEDPCLGKPRGLLASHKTSQSQSRKLPETRAQIWLKQKARRWVFWKELEERSKTCDINSETLYLWSNSGLMRYIFIIFSVSCVLHSSCCRS